MVGTVAATVFSIVSIVLGCGPGRGIDKQNWAVRWSDQGTRVDVALEIADRRTLIGMSREGVLELLGVPDREGVFVLYELEKALFDESRACLLPSRAAPATPCLIVMCDGGTAIALDACVDGLSVVEESKRTLVAAEWREARGLERAEFASRLCQENALVGLSRDEIADLLGEWNDEMRVMQYVLDDLGPVVYSPFPSARSIWFDVTIDRDGKVVECTVSVR